LTLLPSSLLPTDFTLHCQSALVSPDICLYPPFSDPPTSLQINHLETPLLHLTLPPAYLQSHHHLLESFHRKTTPLIHSPKTKAARKRYFQEDPANMSVDWPAVEANAVSLPTIVSTSDLFDGELFGDELIDIYNSSVGDGTVDVANGKCSTENQFRISGDTTI
jgi:hypothetical protein